MLVLSFTHYSGLRSGPAEKFFVSRPSGQLLAEEFPCAGLKSICQYNFSTTLIIVWTVDMTPLVSLTQTSLPRFCPTPVPANNFLRPHSGFLAPGQDTPSVFFFLLRALPLPFSLPLVCLIRASGRCVLSYLVFDVLLLMGRASASRSDVASLLESRLPSCLLVLLRVPSFSPLSFPCFLCMSLSPGGDESSFCRLICSLGLFSFPILASCPLDESQRFILSLLRRRNDRALPLWFTVLWAQ